MENPDDALRRKQLLYRAQRRGFKEADLVIGGFAAANIDALTESELDSFETLLGFPDQDLYDWILGKRPAPDDADGPALEMLRRFNVTHSLAT